MTPISARTRVAGVIGWPIEHSLSPPMQNAAIERLGLDWIYVAMAVEPQRLAEAIAGAAALGFVGLNVTIPHKQAVMALLDEIDPTARLIGAVNTIHFTETGSKGYNTDYEGFTRTVRIEGGFDFTDRTVFQIGAGGAGCAMAVGALQAGAGRLVLADVDRDRERHLAQRLRDAFPRAEIEALEGGDPTRAAADADLIANASPLGMRPDDPLPVPEEALAAHHVVFDAVYQRGITPLLAAARRRGARAVSGLGMLARQGARSLEIWSGRRPDEALMLDVLRRHFRMDP